ncbi:hypothetical protein ACFV5G_33160 [Streptomyces sp. NPDC059766]|uniref:hypothetical protein n=1 Tax=Streptomyces sp. NPDC059766 TaxID=3346940 RepID=UPI0036558DD9
MPGSNGTGSDSEGHESANSSGSSTVFYSVTGSSGFEAPASRASSSRSSRSRRQADPADAIRVNTNSFMADGSNNSPTFDPPGHDGSAGIYDVEAQRYLAANQSGFYRWSKKAGDWVTEKKEPIKRFIMEATPLLLQAAGKTQMDADGNLTTLGANLNVAGNAFGALKGAYQMYQGAQAYGSGNYWDAAAQAALGASNITGAGLAANGQRADLNTGQQNLYQSVGMGIQSAAAAGGYNYQPPPQSTTGAALSQSPIPMSPVPGQSSAPQPAPADPSPGITRTTSMQVAADDPAQTHRLRRARPLPPPGPGSGSGNGRGRGGGAVGGAR